MKKYIAPELKEAKFSVINVIAASGVTAQIIGGDDKDPDNYGTNNGVVEFDWGNANWD